MRDTLGRRIRYLRLSITPRCPMRCVYCRPASFSAGNDSHVLTAEEIERMVAHLVEAHGLQKIRLTGGEPTARADLIEIVERLSRKMGVQEIGLTTNGLTLTRQAGALAAAGLCRVNISLDSLDSQRFARITGVDGLKLVLDGIDASLRAGLTPVKLNTVVIRGENDEELPRLLTFAAERGVEIRFIELMPMGPLAERWAERFVPESQMRQTLECVVEQWHALPHLSESARRYEVRLAGGATTTVGFITSMSCPFCDGCDRMRIAADGIFYPCLMDRPSGTLMPAIRPHFKPEAFDRLLQQGLTGKRAEHPAVGFATMTMLGG